MKGGLIVVGRIKNIDLIKVLAIFIVLLNHFGPLGFQYEQNQLQFNGFLIYRSFLALGAPLFLLCSGYLTLTKEYSIKQTLKRCLLIFFLIFFYKIAYGIAFQAFSFDYEKILFGFTTSIAKDYRVNSLWFLYAFLAITLVLPLLQQIYKNKKLFIYLSIIVIIASSVFAPIDLAFNATHEYELQLLRLIQPFEYHYSFAFAYFLLGGLFRLHDEKLQSKNYSFIIAIALMLLMFVAQSYLAIYLSSITKELIDPMYNGYQLITNVISVSLAFYLLKYKTISFDNRYLRVIANNTFGIYLLHWPLAYYTKIAITNNPNLQSYILNVVYSAFIMFVCLIASYLLSQIPIIKKIVKL